MLEIPHLSFDLFPKNNVYTVFLGRWARVYPFLLPVLPPMPPKQDQFGWYINSCHLRISPTSRVTYALRITFISCFIRRWARFYPFWPPVFPLMPPKQDKFWWYIKSCHLCILLTSDVAYASKITFILWCIGRLAHFYQFWPPVLPPCATKRK